MTPKKKNKKEKKNLDRTKVCSYCGSDDDIEYGCDCGCSCCSEPLGVMCHEEAVIVEKWVWLEAQEKMKKKAL